MDKELEKSEAAAREEEILAFWKENRIFEKSLQKPAPKGEFVFYEGPPTANGRPGVHHLESRAFKDAIPRYRTMRGYRVPRRAGWDTHGLPVEIEVEKQLGFSGKKDIEAYGIAAFNKKCRESVMRYVEEWARFTDRIGYWVDQERAYFTFDPKYIESLWYILKQVAADGRLFKDYKILPWCARCGTALSSHELAQGYEEVKDLSLTVKFTLADEPDTSLLAWTTTPWTLPGNVALAVGEGIAYGRYRKDGEKAIVAKDRAHVLGDGWVLEEEFPGSALVGKRYEPLYPFAEELADENEKLKFAKAFQVYAAPFVITEEGTGIVHTAVMYGADDFALGSEVGLPKVHLVSPDGTFIPGTSFLEGRFVKDDDIAVDILKDLQARGKLFSKENHTHTYPFCWRCKTPLIYYARDSWYIRMQDLREELVAENAKIGWEPSYLKEGRMGEWLRGAKDWAISRERYWGTPLPVWESADKTERLVVGSLEELKKRTKRSGNRYFAMRHGEAENNRSDEIDATDKRKWRLTETGKGQVEKAAAKLKGIGITKIYASPFERTQETAALVARALGLPEDTIVSDERLREFGFGDLDGTSHTAFLERRKTMAFTDAVPGGESYQDAKERFAGFLYELESGEKQGAVLIITHGIGIESLRTVVRGTEAQDNMGVVRESMPRYAEPEELDFASLPHNERYELDLHRPYIDDVVLIGDSGQELRRVHEVMDVWFDSGAMPFAQDHYPFKNKDRVQGKGYPADFISEAIDQTRGWFYTLLAVGVLMKRGTPYRNVISLGHLLDANGKKMSKSKGNVVDPWEAMAEWGVDTLRFWMYSVNQPGDSKNFDEKTLREAARVLSWIENSVKFYSLFAGAGTKEGEPQALDRWMDARVAETAEAVTAAMDAYRPYEATRALASLFEDLSQWYVRRVRDRAREGDAAALATLRRSLRQSVLMLAPFAPFLAEELFKAVRDGSDPESVHLAPWPQEAVGFLGRMKRRFAKEGTVVSDMARVRVLASEGLMLRQKANIKVRQPLAALSIPDDFPAELQELLKEELNVKEIRTKEAKIELDTALTPELVQEGDCREFMRSIADARKDRNLTPKDVVDVRLSPGAPASLLELRAAGVHSVTYSETAAQAPYTTTLSTGTVGFDIELLNHAA